MLSFLSQGISIGFSAGAMPGAFQSYLINTTLSLGWRRSAIAIFTPLLADIPIIFLTVILLGQLPPEVIRIIQLAGGLYLLWTAYGAWKRLRAGVALGNVDTNTAPQQQRQTLLQAVFLIWLSPGPYIFWATINGPLLVKGLNETVWHGLAFVLGFYGTFLGILALYVFIFDRLRRLDERVTRAIFVITLAVMVLFALSLILQALTPSV